jgi:hypothetical protein
MNSRDRLSHGDLKIKIEEQLEEMLRQHQGLRALKEKRRSEEVQSKLEDEKPLEDLLKSLLEHSPTLSNLFLQGLRASNPFKTLKVKEQEQEFRGKTHPTYFKFKDRDYGKEIQRDCHINQRTRIVFETDAVNDYFSRSDDKGQFKLEIISEGSSNPVLDFVGPNLQNGIATLTVRLPDNCNVGDKLSFRATVDDPTLVDPFTNVFIIDVAEEVESNGGKGGRRQPPSGNKGDGRETPAGIALPNRILVYESDWPGQDPAFDKYTALRLGITDTSDNGTGSNGERHDIYDFKINMDNLWLKSELKGNNADAKMMQKRWEYGLVLVGLALLHDDIQKRKSKLEDTGDDDENDAGLSIEKRVEEFTTAIGPVLLPMINSLGSLDLEPAMASSTAGEPT